MTISVAYNMATNGTDKNLAGSLTVNYDNIAPVTPTVTAKTTNVTTPTITGTATVGSGEALTVTVNSITYTVGDGNLTLVTTNWSLTIPVGNALTAGTYSVTATVTDAATNASSDITSNELVIDLTAPVTPTVTAKTTNNTTPTITGTATVGSGEALTVTVNSITYTVGDGNLTLATTNWSLTIPLGNALTAGTYSVTATVTDAATNASSDITSNELVIDLTAPVTPTVTAKTTNVTTPTITGTATVGSGEALTVTVNSITYTVGDGNLTLVTTNWSLTIPVGNALTAGTYSVTATVTDAATNASSDITSNELVIDLTAPVTPTVTAKTTNNTTPTITGTATVGSGEALTVTVNSITYTVGDGNLALVTTNWSLTIPVGNAITAGTYSVTATVTDAATNASSDITSNELVIDITPPPTPVVTGINNDTGSSSSDGITNDQTLTISGTAENNASVEVFIDAASIGTASASGTGAWSFVYGTTLTAASYNITAKATDAAGNVSSASTNYPITIDITAPTMSIGSPSVTIANNSTFVNFVITYSGTSAVNLTSGKVTINHTGTAGGSVTILTPTSTTPTVQVTGVTGNGSYTITIAGGSSTDVAGNADIGAGPSSSVTVDNVTLTPTLTAPATSSASNASLDISFTLPETAKSGTVVMTFIDDNTSYADRTITFNSNFETATVVHSTTLNGNNFLSPADPNVASAYTSGSEGNKLSDGHSYTVKIQYQDLLGNDVAFIQNAGFRYETTPPVATIDAITSPRNTDVGSIVVRFSIGVDYNDVSIADFTLKKDGVDVSGFGSLSVAKSDRVGGSGSVYYKTYTINTSSLTQSSGSYVFTLLTTGSPAIHGDPSNLLTDGTSASWTIDKIAPTVSTINKVTSSPTNASTVDFLVTFSESVSGVSTSSFSLGGTSTGASITSVSSGPGTTRTVTVTTGTSGTLLLNLNTVTGIADLAGNAMSTTHNCDLGYNIDKVAPTVLTINKVSTTPTNLNSVDFIVTFSESVIGGVASNFILDGTAIGASITSVSSGSGTTRTVTVSTGGTDGTLLLNLSSVTGITDDAGNTLSGTHTCDLGYVIDKTAPTVSSINKVSPSSSTNASTVDFTVTFSEVVNGGSTSNFSLSGTAVGASIASVSSGPGLTRTVTVNTGSTDGTLLLNLTTFTGITDNAGNSIAVAHNCDLGYTVDKTLPELNAVTITSNNTHPEVVGFGAGRKTVTITITGSENINVTSATIASHAAFLSHPTGNFKNWTASYDMISSDPTGTILFVVNFTDDAGNIGAPVSTITSGSNVTFDNIQPTLPSVSLSSSNTPNNTTAKVGDIITILFTADDNIENVVAKINGKNAVVTCTDAPSFKWKAEYTMSSADDDNSGAGLVLPFTITFNDYAGNASSPNPVTAITSGLEVTFDKTAPAAPTALDIADGSDIGISTTDNITSVLKPTFEGYAEKSSTVYLYSNVVGSASIGSATADAITGKWSITPAGSLAEGNHIITATATDATGNVSPVSGSLTITIDRTTQAAPPAPSLSAASNSGLTSDNITNVTNATLTGTTADAYSVVKLYNGTSLMATTPTTITSNLLGIWTATITLTTGSNSITATATDAAGNVSSASPALDVTLDVNAPTSPAAPVLALASNSGSSADNITNVNTPIFTGTAENSSTVDLYRGTTLVGTTTANATDGSWSITSTVLSDGGHVMTATATDVAGNTSSASSALNITIDTGNPAKPSTPVLDGTSNSGSTSDNVTNDDTPTITGTVTEIGLNITLYSDGSIIGSGVSDASKNWSIISNSLTNGAHEITAIATDVAGNVSSISNGYTIIIDNLPPVISSITVPSGVYKVGSTIIVTIIADNSNYTNQTLSINGVDQSLVNLYDNTYKANYLVVEGNTERNAVSALPISIVLKDIAGNMNVAETSATVSGGTLTINSSTPLISTITSNAETTGILKIGDPLIFTVTPTVQEAGLIITPTTYNGKTINWATINTGLTYTATYTVQEGDADQTSGLGLGTVTITDAAGNTSSSIYNSVQKKIFGTRPTYEISGGGSRCASSAGLSVTYTFTGVQPYKLKIKKDGVIASSYVDVTSNSYTVTGVLSGTYELGELIDATTNVATEVTSKKAIVTENVNPSITFTPSTLSYNKNDPEVNLMNFVNIDARGGTFSGEGVGSDGYFYPVLIKMGTNSSVTKAISYSVTNAFACTSSKNINITVTLDGGYFSGIDPKYCKNSSAPTSVVVTVLGAGSTSGESFTIIPASNKTSTLAKDKFEINPKEMKAGVYTLKYHYTNTANGNSYDINNNFTIDSLSALLDFTIPSSKYCNNDPISYTLSAVNANNTAGGKAYWSGPATGFTAVVNTNNALLTPSAVTFDPLEVSKEISITYHYESNDGCISSPITRTTTVYAPPVVDFTLKDNYNFDGASELLIGNYSPQGTFSSDKNIIVSSKTITPSNISTSDLGASAKVTYTYTDTNTGCTNTKDRTTIIYKATTPILGLDEKYCFGNIVKTITCNPTDGGNPIGVFTSKLNAISNNLGNSAQYDIGSITNLGDGIDTVKFTYFIGSTEYQVIRRVVIDYIGEVSMNIVNNSDFCKDVTSVPIFGLHPHHSSGNGELVISPLSTSFVTGSGNADFKPSLETIGKHTITYTYTSSIYNNCKSSASIDVWVNPVPVANFEIGEACPGTEKDVPFVNTSTIPSGATMTWNWSFEVGQTATGKDPLYRFKSTGLKSVSLVAKTEKNCQSTAIKPITVGINAKANFSWDNECLIENDSIKFTNKTTGGNTKTAKWIFNGNQISDSISFFKQKFTDLGRYDLKLIIKTVDGCADTVTKSIIIQPYIKFLELPDLTYYQNFESSNSNYNWQTKGISDAFSSKWYLGKPDGSTINIAKSGDNAWFTKITKQDDIENSQVVSPCFDFTGLKKPMIKMDIWSSSEAKRDGAVLQYSLDKGNMWENLGTKGEGQNWFNSDVILTNPAGQIEGWSQLPMTQWTDARHSLDNLVNAKNVRFRIVYAKDATNSEKVDGFAFDNVWIGERQQYVLNEYFTDMTQTSANSYMHQIQVNGKQDIIPIQLHKDDDLYKDYTAGPSSRIFYYGVSQLPYIVSNGQITSSLASADNKTDYKKLINTEILNDPKISITQNNTKTSVGITLTALTDLSNENLVLYCAVVKDSILVGGKYYYNVLRKFYPNPGGIAIPTSGFIGGQTTTLSIPIDFNNSPELIGSKLVIFVQNSIDNKVYQVISYKVTTSTAVDPNSISNKVDIYPNPASDYLMIDCEYSIDRLVIYDVSGRVVGSFVPSMARYSLPLQNYDKGIYIIKGSTRKGDFVKKFIKQ